MSAARWLETPPTESGRHLIALVEALDCSFGLERSIKLSAGRINADRFLISLDRAAIGDDAALATLTDRLALRHADLATLMPKVEASAIVHLGFEGGPIPLYKLYFELPVGTTGEALVHLAVKWPAGGGAAALTRYTLPGALRDTTAIARHLASLDGVGAALAAHIVALARARDAAVFYLDVEEVGSGRRSFDVNVYDANLTVAETGEPLARLARAYGVPIDDLLALHGGQALGHVSSGADRSGGAFATLYFGVAARHGHPHG